MSQVKTSMNIQEMQKFWFYLVRFENYGQKTKKRVNFRPFLPKFQMWIVLFWLDLHD